MSTRSVLFVLAVVTGSIAAQQIQQVTLDTGEVLDGKVVDVTGSRARIQTADGRIVQMPVRRIDRAHVGDEEKRFAAETRNGAMQAGQQALIQRLQRGDELELPELLLATEDCTNGLIDALVTLASSKKAKVRCLAARTLAVAATKESLRAALDAAKDDDAVLREVVVYATSGATLAALAACDAMPTLEQGLGSKDRTTRLACAMAAVDLGSKTALPALAKFVTDADHHTREAAAMCLAEHGDSTGATLLLAIASREQSPAMMGNRNADAATRKALAEATMCERVQAVALLGRLRYPAATAPLRALTRHADEKLAAAARKALDVIEASEKR